MTALGKCLVACVLASPSLAQQTPPYHDPSADQLAPFTDSSMKGRTYRFFTGDPLYPFGYGLSYTTFAYRNLILPAPLRWLAGFERVALRAGESKQVEFSLSARQFSSATANGRRTVQPGAFETPVGGKQPGGLEAATTQVVTGKVQTAGQPKELN